ncbi:MAG: type II toxin-antitoxin system ParD family antitoxin [Paracoccaceae bacterium]
MNISLPDDLNSFAEEQGGGDAYASVSEQLRDLIRRDQLRKQAIDEIQNALDEGWASRPSQPFAMDAFIARLKARGTAV